MAVPFHKLISKTSPVREGVSAPDCELTSSDGTTVHLADYWQDGPAVFVFLRHLGCTFCRQQVLQLRRDYEKFRALGANVVCIAQGEPKVGKAFKIMFDLPYPILMTGEKNTDVFQQYGLGRGTIRELLGLNMWIKGFAALFSLGPKVIGKLEGDGTQMPGVFIVDQTGTVRLAFRSKDAADNPSNTLLLDILQQIEGGKPIDVRPTNAPITTASAH